ncbi:DMT family transporter [Romboutsia lituseburensis]|uniref:DMT family transporter n=1 Tax=Romboutsia lituseburensis TaxID=1537 RepID=UPI00215B360C|nr:DMT family transporter [Romboutsia lituseburensis]MCR8744589.1 DMT family transporter [Romboutsia lituseburensis]
MKEKFEKYMMLFATIFWAGAFIAGKFSIAEFPVFSLVFFRFLIATIIIFIILIKTEENWKITKQDLKTFLVLGVVGMVGYHVFFFLSLKYTTATNSSLIGATNPIVTTILACIFLKDKITYKNILGILISLFGVILITTNGNMSVLFNMKFNIGDILMMVAVLCWATYGVLSKKVLEVYSPIKITSYAFLTCVIILIPLVILEKPWVYIPHTTFNGWMSVIYMAIFPSVGGYLIQQISIKKIGPTKTSLFINLVPVFSMVLAFCILGESISIIKIIAGILIICGICTNLMVKKTTKKEETN